MGCGYGGKRVTMDNIGTSRKGALEGKEWQVKEGTWLGKRAFAKTQ